MIRASFLAVGLLTLIAVSAGAVFARTGGPDAGGYTFIDTSERGGPAFNFLDISGGTDIGSSCDDCVVNSVPIGFSFTFYGTSYTTMNVSSNGNIQFTTSSTAFGNASLPTSTFGPAIAPFWDDLQTNCASTDAIFKEIRGQSPNRMTFVQWRMTPHFPCQQGDITFQVVLFEGTNDILMTYPDVVFTPGSSNNNGGSATVGIQRDSGTGLQYSFNTAAISNGLAICFHPPLPPGSRVASALGCGDRNYGILPPSQQTPNVAGAIGAIVAGADGTRDNLARQAQAQAGAQGAAAAAAASQQAAQPSAGVLRPPSTGDAGLVGQDSTRQGEIALLMAAIALTLIAATVVGGRLRAQRR